MNVYQLTDDRQVFGFQVTNYPAGIDEAFDSIVKKLPDGFNRSFYGICYMENGKMIYKAAAEETAHGEAEKYKCERYTIEKGEYLAIVLKNWREKTHEINGVFHQLVKDPRADVKRPCIEWYKNDIEMVCMVGVVQPIA